MHDMLTDRRTETHLDIQISAIIWIELYFRVVGWVLMSSIEF